MKAFNIKELSEADIRTKFITPALVGTPSVADNVATNRTSRRKST